MYVTFHVATLVIIMLLAFIAGFKSGVESTSEFDESRKEYQNSLRK